MTSLPSGWCQHTLGDTERLLSPAYQLLTITWWVWHSETMKDSLLYLTEGITFRLDTHQAMGQELVKCLLVALSLCLSVECASLQTKQFCL